MKQYIYSNSALHHVVTMVVIFTVSLTFTSTQGFTSPLTGYHSNSPSKRSLTVSSTDNNGANSLLDGQSKTMEALQPQSEDHFNVATGGGSQSQSADYLTNGLLSQLEDLADAPFTAYDPAASSQFHPFGIYAAPPAAYHTTIKSNNMKREEPDSKGQFRLRFGRSGVRLRFGRSDPPTLRFG